ncbi:uncharacterized protein EV422DRAFT_374076 [Fimicolochytrium jonesii]|uniref:uncharacterized protein n=1 Tax=Fimicolochytrium jonesii TaxID=1396493 RepID=UPI0022FE6875|nr:uncharacterized protein EV422DRAFT_374076 [Fimicolochytrium jonesii]KAI8815527.1 hypothetical protein EV422DRAFT_374076 [Fimicolochytrium jonesii]
MQVRLASLYRLRAILRFLRVTSLVWATAPSPAGRQLHMVKAFAAGIRKNTSLVSAHNTRGHSVIPLQSFLFIRWLLSPSTTRSCTASTKATLRRGLSRTAPTRCTAWPHYLPSLHGLPPPPPPPKWRHIVDYTGKHNRASEVFTNTIKAILKIIRINGHDFLNVSTTQLQTGQLIRIQPIQRYFTEFSFADLRDIRRQKLDRLVSNNVLEAIAGSPQPPSRATWFRLSFDFSNAHVIHMTDNTPTSTKAAQQALRIPGTENVIAESGPRLVSRIIRTTTSSRESFGLLRVNGS